MSISYVASSVSFVANASCGRGRGGGGGFDRAKLQSDLSFPYSLPQSISHERHFVPLFHVIVHLVITF